MFWKGVYINFSWDSIFEKITSRWAPSTSPSYRGKYRRNDRKRPRRDCRRGRRRTTTKTNAPNQLRIHRRHSVVRRMVSCNTFNYSFKIWPCFFNFCSPLWRDGLEECSRNVWAVTITYAIVGWSWTLVLSIRQAWHTQANELRCCTTSHSSLKLRLAQ